MDILVASTDNDKLNILACLLGAQLGAKQTVTQIRRTDYMPLIHLSVSMWRWIRRR